MSTTSVILTGHYHLGDNPGLFQEATFVGYSLAIPLAMTLDATVMSDVVFVVETHDLETWDAGTALGHPVSIAGPGGELQLGRLRDPDDTQGRMEVSRFPASRSDLERVLAGLTGAVVLRVDVQKQSPQPGLVDDFVITRFEVGGAIARVGSA